MPTLSQAGGELRTFVLVEMFLPSTAPDALRMSTDINGTTWNGLQWIGLGTLGQIDAVKDGGGEVSALSFTLNGVRQDTISMARAEQVRGSVVKVYGGSYRDQDDTVEWCDLLWSGRLQLMRIASGKDGSSVTVTAEHAGANLTRPNPSFYTHAEQQRIANGDQSLKFIASQANMSVDWPTAAYWTR